MTDRPARRRRNWRGMVACLGLFCAGALVGSMITGPRNLVLGAVTVALALVFAAMALG